MACQICKKVDCTYGRITATYKTWHQVKRAREARAVRRMFLLTQVLFLITLAMFVLSGCNVAGVTIIVDDELAAQEAEITQEVYDALDFIREYHDLDKTKWEHSLQVFVSSHHLGQCGKSCILEGTYYHQLNQIEFWWNRGTCSNVFLHEALHRVSWLQTKTDGNFKHGDDGSYLHNPVFKEYLHEIETAWRKERGCK